MAPTTSTSVPFFTRPRKPFTVHRKESNASARSVAPFPSPSSRSVESHSKMPPLVMTPVRAASPPFVSSRSRPIFLASSVLSARPPDPLAVFHCCELSVPYSVKLFLRIFLVAIQPLIGCFQQLLPRSSIRRIRCHSDAHA